MEKFLQSLCQKALEMGASDVVSIPAEDIIIDKRALLKCTAPLCVNYGNNLMCPPNTMPISQFAEILKEYHWAVLIKVDIFNGAQPKEVTYNNNLAEMWKSVKSAGSANPQSTETSQLSYYEAIRQGQKQVNDISTKIESICMQQGYHFAAGLSPGACMLCDECVGSFSQLPCQHPYEARPSIDSLGIDVIKTCNNAGMKVSFSQQDSRSFIGIVLID